MPVMWVRKSVTSTVFLKGPKPEVGVPLQKGQSALGCLGSGRDFIGCFKGFERALCGFGELGLYVGSGWGNLFGFSIQGRWLWAGGDCAEIWVPQN